MHLYYYNAHDVKCYNGTVVVENMKNSSFCIYYFNCNNNKTVTG